MRSPTDTPIARRTPPAPRRPAFFADTAAPLPISPAVSDRLDLARGVAAVAVLVNHLRGLLFAEYPQVAPEHRTIATKLVYFATGFGHQAVVIFFVLSGLLISRTVVRAIAAGRWSWRWYAEQRLTRLYVVLVPALALGAAWDRVGMRVVGAHGVYAGQVQNTILTFSTAARSGGVSFAGNVLFLQEILVPPFGSNAPLWSLSYEFWYYVAFPAALLAAVGARVGTRVASAAVAAAALALVGPTIRLYFVVWLLGFAVTLVPHGRVAPRAARVLVGLATAALLVVLALVRVDAFHSGLRNDFALGIAFFALLAALPQRAGPSAHGAAAPPRSATFANTLAGFSYTLYLVHLPPLVLVAGLLTHDGRDPWQPDAGRLLLLVPLTAAVLAYAYGVASLTERRTGDVRRVLSAWYARRPGTPAASGWRARGA